MKRRLVVMRHAKSSWKTAAPTDHERPLNNRGRREAPTVGSQLAELGWIPQVVLSSDSLRTHETYEQIASCFGKAPIRVEFLEELYHAGVSELATELVNLPDETTTVLTLGHNPGWESVVYRLSGRYVAMKTSYAALLETDADNWPTSLSNGAVWDLVNVLKPDKTVIA